MNLALFDFDGTITTKDSLGEFIKYAVGSKKYLFGMIKFSPIFISYKLKIMRNDVAKEKLFELFFKDFDEQKFREIAKRYALNEIDKILRDEIYGKFLEHIKNGDRVVVVSASFRCWLEPWAKKQNVELLCTELEFIDEKLTGKFLTQNCHGEEKATRIKRLLSLEDYETIYAYGDSSGDDAMLELAHKSLKI